MYLFLQLVCYVIGMRIAADGYRIVKTIQSANRIFAVERLKSSTRSMNLRTDSFGENAVFGKNFRSAWENLVTAVVSNDRKLYLVTDFDHTLTTFASKQCHDIIALHDEYPKEFHQEYRDICSMEFAAGEFHKWWRIAHDLIVDRSGLTEEMFERGIKSAGIQLRPGTVELIAYCRDSKIPTIITSAGITNVIAAVFEEHGISTAHDDHFYIDANHMEFHLDDGTLQKILPHVPVHSYSKKHVHKRAPHMFTTINHNHRKRSPDQFAESCMSSSIISSQIAEDIVVTESPFKENSRQIVTDCVAEVAPQNNRGSNGVAAIILGDNVGDFEVLRELSDINEASLFRLGYAVNKEKADRLMSLDCCDVILIGDKHNAEVVLMLLKKLVESRDKKAEIKTK